MKREIQTLQRIELPCCPGHDTWPSGAYNNRRSKHARARDKAKEHKYVRTLAKRALNKELTLTEI